MKSLSSFIAEAVNVKDFDKKLNVDYKTDAYTYSIEMPELKNVFAGKNYTNLTLLCVVEHDVDLDATPTSGLNYGGPATGIYTTFNAYALFSDKELKPNDAYKLFSTQKIHHNKVLNYKAVLGESKSNQKKFIDRWLYFALTYFDKAINNDFEKNIMDIAYTNGCSLRLIADRY